VEALLESVWVGWSFLSSYLVECGSSVNSDRELTLESLWCIRIPAFQDTRNITLEWVIYQS
jgi:hypothetical protein